MASDPYTDIIKKEFVIHTRSLRDDIIARQDKDFFWPTGTQIYCGWQGSGKTISAVNHVLKLRERYPKAKLVSNLDLKDFTKIAHTQENFDSNTNSEIYYFHFTNVDELEKLLTCVNNSKFGVIYLIDEIHTYFNALDSKNIPPHVFTEISQQRKQRKLIIGTSQLFLRMAKPFREQCNNLVVCKTILGFITMQRVYDGTTLTQDYDGSLHGDLKKVGWFFHTPKIRNSFDTFQKIQSAQIQFEELNRIQILDSNKKLKLR